MPAFLSHSSKDKFFVGQVAAALNPLEYEFDEKTFDYVLNARAITDALKRCDLAVFFVSSSSISSTFVSEEQRQTLEARAKGTIKQVIVFSIDGTSYNLLPDWMQQLNMVQRVTSPKSCARRIQAALLEIASRSEPELVYLGRDDEEAQLRKALVAPGSSAPIALHMVGFPGIGRRTFLRNSLTKLFPRYYSVYLEVTVRNHHGVEELYRSLYALHKVSSQHDAIEDFTNFSAYDSVKQLATIADMVKEMNSLGEFLLIYDEGGGVYDDGGDFLPHWAGILENISDMGRPAIAFVQTRMQPYATRHLYPRDFHQKIEAISEISSYELVGFALKANNISYSEAELSDVVSLVDGHPYNLRFVASYIKAYGIQAFVKDPGQFIKWRDRRGEEFLAQIDFSETAQEIIACLIDYRAIATEALLEIIQRETDDVIEAIRDLQDVCCIEFRDGFFHLANPIREAARRDGRFLRSDAWRLQVAAKICDLIAAYPPDDQVFLGILENATMAAVRGGKAPDYVRLLVLPSHLLLVAREHYDNDRRAQCISICKQAFEMRSRTTREAQVEMLRLWSLSAARSGDNAEFSKAVGELAAIPGNTAKRVRLFAEAFKDRLEGRLDDAEKKFLQAWNFSKTNAAINRELAKLYCRQRRYDEAETYARSSYSTSPTNPYIIDIMLEMLIGKRGQGLTVDEREIDAVTKQLYVHGNKPGMSFYSVREAQNLLYKKNYKDAIDTANAAIAQTPFLIPAFFIRLEAQLRGGYADGAERTIEEIRTILRRNGLSEGDEARVAEAEIDLMLARGQLGAAKERVSSDRKLPSKVRAKVVLRVASAIKFAGAKASQDLRDWARKASGA